MISCQKKNYKIIIEKGTPGDSKIFHTSNLKLKKLFPKIKFTPISQGLKKYFNWIKKVPVKKDISKFHPFKFKIKF